jgi:hypothetical protein
VALWLNGDQLELREEEVVGVVRNREEADRGGGSRWCTGTRQPDGDGNTRRRSCS